MCLKLKPRTPAAHRALKAKNLGRVLSRSAPRGITYLSYHRDDPMTRRFNGAFQAVTKRLQSQSPPDEYNVLWVRYCIVFVDCVIVFSVVNEDSLNECRKKHR